MMGVDNSDREIFAALADVLIPEAEGMPSASAVGVHQAVLDHILALRPDLAEAFLRRIAFARGKPATEAAQSLNLEDSKALSAIGLIASAAYYMCPRIRSLIGYPGQEPRAFDPEVTPEYIVNGMLKVVQDRGAIYRPTPKGTI